MLLMVTGWAAARVLSGVRGGGRHDRSGCRKRVGRARKDQTSVYSDQNGKRAVVGLAESIVPSQQAPREFGLTAQYVAMPTLPEFCVFTVKSSRGVDWSQAFAADPIGAVAERCEQLIEFEGGLIVAAAWDPLKNEGDVARAA